MARRIKKNEKLFISIVVLGLILMSSVSLNASIVANWDFEYNFEDDWYSHDGTGHNTPGFFDLGIYDSAALRLRRGASEYVSVPDATEFRSNSFTVLAWARVLGWDTSSQVVVNRGVDGAGGLYAGYKVYRRGGDQKWAFRIGARDGGTLLVATEETPRGQWAHIAASFEQTGTHSTGDIIGTMRLYVNGTVHYRTNVRYNPQASSLLYIGADHSGGGTFNYFDGLIDDVRIYSHMLTTATINDRYDAGDIPISVMTYNVNYGGHDYAPSPYNYDRVDDLIDVVEQYEPDVLILQECSRWTHPDYLTLEYFSAQLGMPYTHISHEDTDNWFKVAILSRYPLNNKFALPTSVPFWQGIIDAKAQVTTTRKFGICNLHFAWWGDPDWTGAPDDSTGDNADIYSWQRDYLRGSTWLGYHLSRSYPFVVGGDWNHHLEPYYPFGTNLHRIVADMGFGLNKLQEFQGTSVDPVDTFYVSDSYNKLEVLDCEKIIVSPSPSDHSPVTMEFLLKE